MTDKDWKHLHQFGYAPGNYMTRCQECKETCDHLDKRAVTCFQCATNLYVEHTEFMKNFNVLQYMQEVCAFIGHTKDDQSDIMLSKMEETGELATEIKIARGLKPGPAGYDGVVGEAIDDILCALDILYTELGSLDNDRIKQTIINKATKWKNKYGPKA